ncbi:hypothetical protein C1645_815639 [Glomus cerebriforme]|uniref:Uncharacterized protein n=1 Tax=Glomus cerebriforme TaxID=658196 RepID=A0A397TH12_9GLOM|nr:hypothetical protein C1645_815639 [Glomus cerebriforme]
MIKTTDNIVNNYLYLIDKEKEDFLKERMNLLNKKLMYSNLHRISKDEDELDKVLGKNSDDSDKENTEKGDKAK